MTDIPDSSLQTMLFAAASGDERAWRALVDAYSGRVFALVRSQCGNGDLAEEITQSTFCTMVVKLAEYTELGKFEGWLFRIAMNRLRDEMRRRKRQAVAVEADALTALAGAGRDDGIGVGQDELVRLRLAMGELSEADRHVIHLRHYAEMSFKQIAEMLEQPLGTVLARQHRALQKLADLMQKGPGGRSGSGSGLGADGEMGSNQGNLASEATQ